MSDPRPSHERIETARLILRRPEEADADAIFERWASCPETTRYLGWPTHRTRADTVAFLGFAAAEWHRGPAGPYVIEFREGAPAASDPSPGASDGSRVIGSTGLALETTTRAQVGYVVARPWCGRGIATEALAAMVRLAPTLGVRRLYALCHPEHAASARVLEKCGFEPEGRLRLHQEFPNLDPPGVGDVDCYARLW